MQTPTFDPQTARIIQHVEAQRNQALTAAALASAERDALAEQLQKAEQHIEYLAAQLAAKTKRSKKRGDEHPPTA